MRWIWLAILGVLAGCGTPSPHFAGAAATRIAIDGSVFDVRVRGDLAEAVRRNPQYAPRLGPIRVRAALAMQQASGCAVEHVLGDAAVAVGLLQCDGGTRDWARVLQTLNLGFECYEVGGLSGGGHTTFQCDPI